MRHYILDFFRNLQRIFLLLLVFSSCEIEDEHDSVDLLEEKINDREYKFSTRLEVDYINELYDLKIKYSIKLAQILNLLMIKAL